MIYLCWYIQAFWEQPQNSKPSRCLKLKILRWDAISGSVGQKCRKRKFFEAKADRNERIQRDWHKQDSKHFSVTWQETSSEVVTVLDGHGPYLTVCYASGLKNPDSHVLEERVEEYWFDDGWRCEWELWWAKSSNITDGKLKRAVVSHLKEASKSWAWCEGILTWEINWHWNKSCFCCLNWPSRYDWQHRCLLRMITRSSRDIQIPVRLQSCNCAFSRVE